MKYILAFLSVGLASSVSATIDVPLDIGPPRSQGNSPVNPLASQYIPSLTYSGPNWVCASDISTKVFQQGGSCADSWALTASTPSGVRNEVVSSQIHIINAPSLLQNVSISMTKLTHTQYASQVISTQTVSATNNVVVYVSSYVYISTPSVSVSSQSYFGQWNVEIPDAMIPTIDPYYHQATTVMPLTVQAGFNQSFVYSIWVPSGIPSGYYSGSIFISTGSTPANATVVATVPVAFELFDATMPVTATYGSFNGVGYGDLCVQTWGNNNTCNRYGKYNCPNSDVCTDIVAHDEAVWMLDHKWSAGGMNGSGHSFSTLQPIFDNIWRSSASAYYINPILVGATMTSAQPESIGGSNNTTMTSFQVGFINNSYNNSLAMPFNYACDEPSGGGWSGCFTSMQAFTSTTTNLITSNYNNFLTQGATGTVSIMNTLVEDYNLNSNPTNTVAWVNVAPSTRAFGYYSDCVSGANNDGTGPCNGTPGGGGGVGKGTGYPNPHIDGRPVANRADQWVMMRDTATFQLNSTATQCWATSTGCGQVVGVNSVWTFATGMQYKGVGDENWLYPGGQFLSVGSTPTIVGSYRFDLEMAGEQDHEYWNILANNSQLPYAQTQLANWMSAEYKFNEDAYKGTNGFTGTITMARQNMGCKIHTLKWPGASCGW